MSKSSMSLIDHLGELRNRLILCFVIVTSFAGVCWFFKTSILHFIAEPLSPYLSSSSGKLIFTAPMDEFLAHIKISIFGGLVLGFPFLIYQVWRFIAPGLYKKEKKLILLFSFLGSLLFFLGMAFVYYIIYPLSFRFLMGGGSAEAFISIREYLSFFVQTSLAFGFLFEAPLIVMVLVFAEVLSIETLKQYRRHALVLIALLSAVLTPPDVLSMLFLMIPLYFLYEISILTSSFFTKKKQKL